MCIPIEKVCNGLPDCFLADDEIFCHVLCPAQCLCISTAVICSNTGISKIPSFGEKYENNIHSLSLEGNPLQLHVRSFVCLKNLQYLNISNSNLKYLCLGKISIFLYMEHLLILDISKNNILVLSTLCIYGLSSLKILYIQQNPLCSIQPKSFFNLYSLPVLKINDMHLEYLGNYFFCSAFNNNLQTLDISQNKLHIVYSNAFKCLFNLKVLLIYGNKFHKFVNEDIIRNLHLDFYLVEYSIECCKKHCTVCIFIKKLSITCTVMEIHINILNQLQLSILILGFILNGVLMAILLLRNLYQKKPLQFLLTIKDMIAILCHALVCIYTLTFSSQSAHFQMFCLTIGIITSATLTFDLLAKISDSFFLLKLLHAKSVQSGPGYSVIFRFYSLMFIFCFVGTFISIKILSMEEYVSSNTKLRETILHCVLFCFAKYQGILVHMSLILLFLTFWITFNLTFIHLIRAQILHMKNLCLRNSNAKKKLMIKHVYFASFSTSFILIILCLFLLALLFTDSFLITYSVVIILCLFSVNNFLIFILSNKSSLSSRKK